MLSTGALYHRVTVTEILNCLKGFHVHKFNGDKAVQSDYFIIRNKDVNKKGEL